MAEKKKNWDEWIKDSTNKLGAFAKTGSMAGGALGAGAGLVADTVKREVDAYKKLQQMNRPKSKDYQSLKDVKKVGSAGRESAEKARESDKKIREKFKGDMVKIDPETRRLKAPPRPLY
jgi:hypothetical protein